MRFAALRFFAGLRFAAFLAFFLAAIGLLERVVSMVRLSLDYGTSAKRERFSELPFE